MTLLGCVKMTGIPVWRESENDRSRRRATATINSEEIPITGQEHIHVFIMACYATLHPTFTVRPSFSPSVGRSHFTLFNFWAHFSGPNALVTSNTAPAHPHATAVSSLVVLTIQDDPTASVKNYRPMHTHICLRRYSVDSIERQILLLSTPSRSFRGRGKDVEEVGWMDGTSHRRRLTIQSHFQPFKSMGFFFNSDTKINN